jgi:DNA-binding SARP family transcriptional activator
MAMCVDLIRILQARILYDSPKAGFTLTSIGNFHTVQIVPSQQPGLKQMKTAPIAKIARPKLSSTVKRDRLFRLLDQGKQKPVIWITAQGGSGKTTLVADWLDTRKLPCLWYQVDEGDGDVANFFYYMGIAAKHAAPRYKKSLPLLTPEYLQGIPVFTRRYFEELFSRLKSPSVVVLDNYQDAPLGSGFHDMMANGLDTIPEGISVVILSRAAPPPQFARLAANNRLHTLGWDEIRFTREESADMFGPQTSGKLSADALRSLYDKTEGWAAGLIMLTAGAGLATPEPAADMTADKLFDYFAGEIFSKTDRSIQEVLLKTSVLQKIDPLIAEQLTGNPLAGQILARLSRNHYFTQKYEQTYQYHPLFRAFLLAQARQNFTSEQLACLQAEAATLLIAAGQIEEAADLFCAAHDWQALTRLIVAHAGQLMVQGRSHTVMQWLNQMPPEVRDADGWLLYWLGLCRLAMQPGLSRVDFERAYAHFEQRDDVTGLYLAWAGIIDTYVYEWGDFRPVDRWIVVLESLRARHPVFPSAEIEARVAAGMFNALSWRQPWHPNLAAWEARVMSLVFSDIPVALRTMLGNHAVLYHLWMGDIAKAGVVIETLRAVAHSTSTDPLTRIHWYGMASMHAWFVAEHEQCLAFVAEGLQLAETSGVHLLDIYLLAQGVYSSVAANQRAAAEEYLLRMSQQPIQRLMDKSLYFYQAASVAWLQNDMPRCNEYSRIAIDLAEQTGSALPDALCRVEFASVLFNQGEYDEAAEQLDCALALGRGISGPLDRSKFDRSKLPGKGMNLIDFVGGIAEANWALRRGETGRAVELLRDVLARGARQGYVNFPRWHSPTMSRLCALALEYDIEVDYVKRLIRLHDLVPDAESPVIENWPYRIRINVLGQFSLTIADELLRSSGKQQRKPVELLQLLVAAGQRGLPLEQVVDTLWPDMDSDKAYNAYTSAVYRVRKLVGSEDAVLTHEGRVMLNPHRCYVDAWAFEHLIGQAARLRGIAPDEAARLLTRAIGAYQGVFLNDEHSEEWAIGYRERLHGKFVRAVLDAGRDLEERRDFESALDFYQRGIERDELAEVIYQQILACCHELGRHAEGLAVFEQCRRRMQSSLNIAPSAQTLVLRDQLMAGG